MTAGLVQVQCIKDQPKCPDYQGVLIIKVSLFFRSVYMLRDTLEPLQSVQIAQVLSFSSALINRFHCKSMCSLDIISYHTIATTQLCITTRYTTCTHTRITRITRVYTHNAFFTRSSVLCV